MPTPLRRRFRLGSALPVLAAVIALLAFGQPALANGSKEAGGQPASVRIRSLMIPVVNAGQLERYTQLEVTMELNDAGKLPEAQTNLPRITDAVLTVLYAAIEKGWIVRGSITNATALRRQLADTGQRLIGKDSIARVLITPTGKSNGWQ